MSCCAPGIEAAAHIGATKSAESDNESLLAASKPLGEGLNQLELAVPDVHCATCISTIERDLGELGMVHAARVNLSTKRVRITYDPEKGSPDQMTAAVTKSGHRILLLEGLDEDDDGQMGSLIRAMAVAGFAAGNIMLFSVSVWSGAEEATRDLFHWISALIAIPTVGFSGQVFFRSAIAALRHGRLNMDVPISLAVVLALCMSIFETARGAELVYFDASVSLLFFLLVGRTLDHMMREKARGAVKNLAQLSPRSAVQILPDGRREAVAIGDIEPGMVLSIFAGQRIPVDGEVIEGVSEADVSLVSGEAEPEPVEPGQSLLAGTLILSGSISLKAEQPADKSFLARMIELMEAAEGSKAGYRRVADKAAEIYAPAVHMLALSAFLGWGLLGGDWHVATVISIAVLIITCPCALGLAVPMVHIVAAGRLFEAGIVMKDGAALERMALVDHVVFDKTGTLTVGKPRLKGQILGNRADFAQAARLARRSAHPFSVALGDGANEKKICVNEVFEGQVDEVPGQGLKATDKQGEWRLGHAEWCGVKNPQQYSNRSQVWLSLNQKPVAGFELSDTARPEAKEAIDALKAAGVQISLLSGDRAGPVHELATELGIAQAEAQLTPADKVSRIQELQKEGHNVLMVGDGINDAPALRAAQTSMAPASAADVGRSAADFIFTRDNLSAVPATLLLSRRSATTVKENFGLALAYNIVAVPLAMSGHVTPLIAALAMSTSSVLVTLNALKLRFGNEGLGKAVTQKPAKHSPAASQKLELAE